MDRIDLSLIYIFTFKIIESNMNKIYKRGENPPEFNPILTPSCVSSLDEQIISPRVGAVEATLFQGLTSAAARSRLTLTPSYPTF